ARERQRTDRKIIESLVALGGLPVKGHPHPPARGSEIFKIGRPALAIDGQHARGAHLHLPLDDDDIAGKERGVLVLGDLKGVGGDVDPLVGLGGQPATARRIGCRLPQRWSGKEVDGTANRAQSSPGSMSSAKGSRSSTLSAAGISSSSTVSN